MNDPSNPTRLARRDFLRAAGTTVAGTATATALAVPAAEAKESPAERVKSGYRESDHVKTYYRANRY